MQHSATVAGVSSTPFELKIRIGEKPIALHLFERDFVSDIIRRDGYWEMTQTRLLSLVVGKTAIALDIGANLGYFTVVLSRLASEGVIHAFEPDSDNFALLERNCALNGCVNVRAHHVALSDGVGSIALYRNIANRGDHRLARLGNSSSPTTIQTAIGDEMLADVARADVIKCDVQGSEFKVFSGLRRLLDRSNPKPVMIVEFEPLGLATMGDSPTALLDLFDSFGYRYEFINWENIFPINRSTLIELSKHWLAGNSPGNLDLVLFPQG
jgi:FkbM family methyltransferase